MFLLLILPLLYPSESICLEVSSTNVKPLVQAYDSQHLFINYSNSFKGDISRSKVIFRGTVGYNLPIKDNLVKTSICLNYDRLWVEIEGVKSQYFSYIPFSKDTIDKSLSRRTCRNGFTNEVVFDIEGFRKESLIHDSCLSFVQLRSGLHGDKKIGPEIRNESTVVEVTESYFRVCAQMKPVAPKTTLTLSSLKSCLVKPLQQVQVQEGGIGSTTTGVIIGAPILFIILVIGVIILKLKNKPNNNEIDQNPEYGQQEYYYEDEQKRTNIVEDNEEYDGGAYATDKECYVKDTNNAYADINICQD